MYVYNNTKLIYMYTKYIHTTYTHIHIYRDTHVVVAVVVYE